MKKIAKSEYNKMVEDAKQNLKEIASNFWDVSKLDVEIDSITYFYEVKESRIYLEMDKVQAMLML